MEEKRKPGRPRKESGEATASHEQHARIRAYRDEIYPPVTMDVCQENIDDFFLFMWKRHDIWRRRFIKKYEKDRWTKDKILKQFKYTNVYRQLDRGSLFALEVIIDPIKELISSANEQKTKNRYMKNLIWKLMLYRICNRIDTFEETGIPDYNDFNVVAFYRSLLEVWKKHSIMTSAHLTCPCGKGLSKAEGYTFGLVNLWLDMDKVMAAFNEAVANNNPKKAVKAFQSIHGVGGFTAYEVYCDLCYSGLIPWTTNDFVNIGPGAMEGIRLLYPSTPKSGTLEKIHLLHREQNEHFKRLGIQFQHYEKFEPVNGQMSLRCIEHSLCEYSKYFLQKAEKGKRRLVFKTTDGRGDHMTGHMPTCKVNPDTGDTLVLAPVHGFNDGFDFSAQKGSKTWNEFKRSAESAKPQSRLDFCKMLKAKYNP